MIIATTFILITAILRWPMRRDRRNDPFSLWIMPPEILQQIVALSFRKRHGIAGIHRKTHCYDIIHVFISRTCYLQISIPTSVGPKSSTSHSLSDPSAASHGFIFSETLCSSHLLTVLAVSPIFLSFHTETSSYVSPRYTP